MNNNIPDIQDLLILDCKPSELLEHILIRLIYDVQSFKVSEYRFGDFVAVHKDSIDDNIEGIKWAEDIGFYAPKISIIKTENKKWNDEIFIP